MLPTVVYTLVFGKYANFPSDKLPYPIFAFASVLIWQYFSAALTVSSGSLVAIQSAVAPGTQVWAWAAKGKPAARSSAYNPVRSTRAECLAAVALEEPPQLKLPQFLLTSSVVVEDLRRCR